MSYIDLKKLTIPNGFFEDLNTPKLLNWLHSQEITQVVNRAYYDEICYKLLGVMHSVDKWLDGEELAQDEVNRAATMREKTLKIIEDLNRQLRHHKTETENHEVNEIVEGLEDLLRQVDTSDKVFIVKKLLTDAINIIVRQQFELNNLKRLVSHNES